MNMKVKTFWLMTEDYENYTEIFQSIIQFNLEEPNKDGIVYYGKTHETGIDDIETLGRVPFEVKGYVGTILETQEIILNDLIDGAHSIYYLDINGEWILWNYPAIKKLSTQI